MTEILSWIFGIVIKVALLTAGWIVIKAIIKNGGGTLKMVLETIGLAIKAGCLTLRMKLTQHLAEKAEEEEEPIEEDPKRPGVKVEGTVV